MEQDLRERLLQRAFLYEDPLAYQAGVDATMRELAHLLPPAEDHLTTPVAPEQKRAAG